MHDFPFTMEYVLRDVCNAELKRDIQAEKERTENLNRDARNIDGSDFGIGDYSVKVERAAEVPASNIASYNDVADKIQSLSRGFAAGYKACA